MPVTNIALNHLLLLAENDPDDAFELVEIISQLSAELRLGDGSRWSVTVLPLS